MELQLGLALIPTVPTNPTKGFDLNRKDCSLESKFGLAKNCKGSFEEALLEDGGNTKNLKLSLLCWSGQPNDEDDGKGERKGTSFTGDKDEEEEDNHIVGWPPIKAWRKKVLHCQQSGRIMEDRTAERRSPRSNSMYVKVKMEGVPIGRKINLRLFHSYQTLSDTLMNMFGKYQKFEENYEGYTLLYQDNQGDWIHAEDVPWQTFMESVCRLEILRNGGYLCASLCLSNPS